MNESAAKRRSSNASDNEADETDEGDEESNVNPVPRFYDGLGGGDPARLANVPNKKKEVDSSYPSAKRRTHSFALCTRRSTSSSQRSSSIGTTRTEANLNQDTRHALVREIEACSLELERIAKTLK